MPAPTKRPASRTRRRVLRTLAVLLCVLTLPVILFAPGCLTRMAGGKYGGVAIDTGPNPTAKRPVRVEQSLPHTCGLRAMEAAYFAYGLDPDALNIRYRLGTDYAAVPTDPTSTGTLHPDLLRVLAQDGFTTTVLDLDQPDALQQLADHLGRDQLALTVVYRSTYHWMVLADDGPGRVWVVDSLSAEGTSHGIDGFIEDQALSIILIAPRDTSADAPSRNAQHLLGTREMARTYDRQQARGE